jgi:hypothetical protein
MRAKKWQGRLSRKQSIALPKVVNARGRLTVNRASGTRRGEWERWRAVNGPLAPTAAQDRWPEAADVCELALLNIANRPVPSPGFFGVAGHSCSESGQDVPRKAYLVRIR